MKRILIYCVIISLVLLLAGCNSEKNVDNNKNTNDNDEIIYVTLKINMPLAFEDLDKYFELSIIDELDKSGIGEVIGDGFPIDENGPYATDIEIDLKQGKLEQLKSIILKYRYPKGSYLEINGEKDSEFGDLLGVRINFVDLEDYEIEKVYETLKNNIKDSYIYSTIIEVNQTYTAYFYGESLSVLKDDLYNQLDSQKIKENVLITEMPDFIKEL